MPTYMFIYLLFDKITNAQWYWLIWLNGFNGISKIPKGTMGKR